MLDTDAQHGRAMSFTKPRWETAMPTSGAFFVGGNIMTKPAVALLTLPEVMEQLKVGRSSIYSWMLGEGVSVKFPAPRKLGTSNRWAQCEVQEWLKLQPRAIIGGL